MPKSSNNGAKMCIIKQNNPKLHFCELIKLDSEFQDYKMNTFILDFLTSTKIFCSVWILNELNIHVTELSCMT